MNSLPYYQVSSSISKHILCPSYFKIKSLEQVEYLTPNIRYYYTLELKASVLQMSYTDPKQNKV